MAAHASAAPYVGSIASRLRSLLATKGYSAPEVERVYARAHDLCRQVGETPRLASVLEVIETARLSLEPLRADHAAEMAPLLDDEALHRYIGGHPATQRELRDRYRPHGRKGSTLQSRHVPHLLHSGKACPNLSSMNRVYHRL